MVEEIFITNGPSEAEILEIMNPKNPKDYIWFRDNIEFAITCKVRTGKISKPASFYLSRLITKPKLRFAIFYIEVIDMINDITWIGEYDAYSKNGIITRK